MAKKQSRDAKISPVQVLTVERQDSDGHLWAWGLAGTSDPIQVWLTSGQELAKLKVGDRALCRLGPAQPDGSLSALVIKALPAPSVETLFGKVEGPWLLPSDRRARKPYRIRGGLAHSDGNCDVGGQTGY